MQLSVTFHRTSVQNPPETLTGTGFVDNSSNDYSPLLHIPIEPFRQEFVEGSAIAPALYEIAVQVRDELEIDPYTHEGESWPIHEALGWDAPSTQYQTRKPHRFGAGAFLLQETGDTWQIKPQNPRLAPKDKGTEEPTEFKPVKYETPRGAGSRAYLPPIDPATLQAICDRHGLDFEAVRGAIASAGGFWAWVASRADLRVILTEGGKKSLSLLSHGFIAIALTGCWGAIQAKNGEERLEQARLIADLQPFAAQGRPIAIALDIDLKRKTRRTVWKATCKTICLLEQAGCTVAIAQWDNARGRDKGVDDLIVNRGIGAFEQALATARSAKELKILWQLQNPLGKYRPDLVVDVPDLSEAINPISLPPQGILVLQAPMATGKTKLIRKILDSLIGIYPGAIAPGHRQSLQRGFGERLGLDFLNDLDRFKGQKIGAAGLPTKRLSLCYDSILAINPKDYPPGSYVLVLDEADQGFWHLLLGATCGKDGKRPALIARAIELIQNAGLVILASADITEKEVDFVCSIRNEQPFILQNTYQRSRAFIDFYAGDSEIKGSDRAAKLQVLSKIWEALTLGKRVWVAVDTLKLSKEVERIALIAGISADKILRFDGETSSDQKQRAFANSPKELAKNYQIVIHNSSLTSGVSVEIDHFQVVFGLFTGQTIAPWDCTQMLGRVRQPVPRVVYARQYGKKSHLSRGRNHLQVSTDLADRTGAIARSLGEDTLAFEVDTASPAAAYASRAIAETNTAMADFALQIRLRLELQHEVVDNAPVDTVQALEADKNQQIEAQPNGLIGPYLMGRLLEAIDAEIKRDDAQAIAHAPALAADEAKKLRDKTFTNFEDRRALERFDLCDFCVIAPEALTVDDVLFDAKGKMRRGISRIEGLLWDGLTLQRDRASLEGLRAWGYKLPAQDLPTRTMRADLMESLGIADVLERVTSGEQWSADTPWVVAFAERCLANPKDCDRAFGFTPNPSQSPNAILGTALRAMSLKTKSRRLGTGDRERVYSIDHDHLDAVRATLFRRAERHLQQGLEPRPQPLTLTLLGSVAGVREKRPETCLIDAPTKENEGAERALDEYRGMDLAS